MNTVDHEILHKIIETQGCVIQGRSLKALLHQSIDFYLEKSGADIITICMNEFETVNLEYILEKHRDLAHLVKKYNLTKKKLDWERFVKNCKDHFDADKKYVKVTDSTKFLKEILNEKEAEAFNSELQMSEAVLMPMYAFDQHQKIGYIAFIFKTQREIDVDKLLRIQSLFQTLLQPLYDSQHNMVFTRCSRVDDNMNLLTEQEKRIVRRVLNGQPYPEIAEMLEISINTLKTHMKNIFNKYNVSSKIELQNKLNSTP